MLQQLNRHALALTFVLGVTSQAIGQPADAFTTIEFPGAIATLTAGLNAGCDVAGTHYNAGSLLGHGFLLSGDNFVSFDVPGASQTLVNRMNERGDIVGHYVSAGVTHGFLLSQGQFASIDVPGAVFTIGREINAQGDILGVFIPLGGFQHGFVLGK